MYCARGTSRTVSCARRPRKTKIREKKSYYIYEFLHRRRGIFTIVIMEKKKRSTESASTETEVKGAHGEGLTLGIAPWRVRQPPVPLQSRKNSPTSGTSTRRTRNPKAINRKRQTSPSHDSERSHLTVGDWVSERCTYCLTFYVYFFFCITATLLGL